MGIHKFHLNGKNIVLDVNSGSVHVVDELVFDILDFYKESTLEDIILKLENRYDKSDIKEAYKEIKKLEDEELLYSKDHYEKHFNYKDQNIVKALCLHVAHDCNLNCKYCFASQGNYSGKRELMPLDVGKKALEFLVKNSRNRKNLDVDFFGGEPLLNFEVVKELVIYGRKLQDEYDKNISFTITTNGLLLDDEKIDFINEHMENVVLSLDGRKEVHDKMRPTINNKGSYDLIVQKFKKLIEKRGNKDYFIRGTFTRDNLDFSKDVLHYKELGFDVTSLEPVVCDPNEDYSLLEEHIEKILEEYEKLSKEYIKINKSGERFIFYHFVIDLDQGPCVIRRVTGCGAGSNYLAVTPSGDLYPCHQFVDQPQFKIGDVFNGIIREDLRDKFRSVNIYTKEECKDCWAKFYCSGGCMANAYYINKDITKPYKLGCAMEKKRIECALSIAANLKD
ncbi:thioether cross-link-forming SCIFF peptide maturase [Thermohalobacter berrensis]|uniref:Thioether cross-link-forming SCIFF peptide maturase n=1 Tax=Thermohalobacter berrensis TaxID=99594 RepID=A0A419TB00_9FIRM|nr:thioether cross-link-forming SCIFF peptide maturase [Thermohalobacter berrensis]RKD34656.1 thioether cross-link-forming SCIFF peptide maturase [Thermohalobacter berrensis]